MRLITSIALFITAIPSAAMAQQPAESFAELSKLVKKGQVVFVEDETGRRVKGNVTDLSDSTLHLMTTGVAGREVTFDGSRIARVSRVDSRVNGFLIGAAIGAAGGIYSASMVDMLFENEASNADWTYPVFGGLMALAGGGIGCAIDGAIDGQKLVFARRAGRGAGAGVRIRPLVGKVATGASVSITF